MGSNPYKEKMLNQGIGREMGREDDEKPQDVNVQEIDTDAQVPGPNSTVSNTKLT
jgi:hypothetical protein